MIQMAVSSALGVVPATPSPWISRTESHCLARSKFDVAFDLLRSSLVTSWSVLHFFRCLFFSCPPFLTLSDSEMEVKYLSHLSFHALYDSSSPMVSQPTSPPRCWKLQYTTVLLDNPPLHFYDPSNQCFLQIMIWFPIRCIRSFKCLAKFSFVTMFNPQPIRFHQSLRQCDN